MLTKIAKPFKTFEEQVNILEKENLIISNKERLINYLTEFNFQKVIDGSNNPFLEEHKRHTNNKNQQEYIKDITSDDVLNFFDYNMQVSDILIKEILRFENRINTSICYHVLEKMKNFSPSLLQVPDEALCNLLCYDELLYSKDGTNKKY